MDFRSSNVNRAPAIFFHYHTSYVTWSYRHASSDICWENTILHIVMIIQFNFENNTQIPFVKLCIHFLADPVYTYIYIHTYICMYVYMCVCVCVCIYILHLWEVVICRLLKINFTSFSHLIKSHVTVSWAIKTRMLSQLLLFLPPLVDVNSISWSKTVPGAVLWCLFDGGIIDCNLINSSSAALCQANR